jgi:FMN phosphatase YigB (HAD superfamily)
LQHPANDAMPPRFLYFDLGNVLLSFSHDRMCRQMAEVAGLEPEAVRRLLFEAAEGRPLQWRFEAGEVDAAAAYEHFCREAGCRPEQAALEAAASDMFAELPESVALVRRLAALGYRLGVLSNTNPLDFNFCRRTFPFLEECFELAVVSYEARAMKPGPEIFRYAVERAGVASPGEVFFTDDREENVAGALAVGLDAVLFESAEQVAQELARRGVAGAV